MTILKKDIDRNNPTDVFYYVALRSIAPSAGYRYAVATTHALRALPLRRRHYRTTGAYANNLPNSSWLISFSSILATPLSAS